MYYYIYYYILTAYFLTIFFSNFYFWDFFECFFLIYLFNERIFRVVVAKSESLLFRKGIFLIKTTVTDTPISPPTFVIVHFKGCWRASHIHELCCWVYRSPSVFLLKNFQVAMKIAYVSPSPAALLQHLQKHRSFSCSLTISRFMGCFQYGWEQFCLCFRHFFALHLCS